MTDYSRPRPPLPPVTPRSEALIRAHALQIARLSLGPVHPGVDALADLLAHVARSWGRHGADL